MAPITSPISRVTGKPITPQRVRELLDYDPVTGIFRWRAGASYGDRRLGQIAGSKGTRRQQIRLEGRLISSHRIAWAYMTGRWPDREIDHRDGNGANNAFANLRECSRSENTRNTRIDRANNHAGHRGVSYRADNGKWRARIGVNGVKMTIGVFATKEEAVAAWRAAAIKYHGEFARLE